MKWLSIIVLLAATTVAHSQADLPTELEDCTGSEADFCFDGTAALVDSGCGARFEGYAGRIAWPVMKNVGPVTIAVQTRYTPAGQTVFPLYVEARGRDAPGDVLDCRTGLGGQLVLVAHGADRCGGTWESIGPIDLQAYGVPLGAPYNLQCVFFRTTPTRVTARTVGFSCIRVTSIPAATMAASWGSVKTLYH
jgi:hypothetical protein